MVQAAKRQERQLASPAKYLRRALWTGNSLGMYLSFSRTSVATYLPHLEMYGGVDDVPRRRHASFFQIVSAKRKTLEWKDTACLY